MFAFGSFNAPATWLMEVSKSEASWNAAAPVATTAGVSVCVMVDPACDKALLAGSSLAASFCCTIDSVSACL